VRCPDRCSSDQIGGRTCARPGVGERLQLGGFVWTDDEWGLGRLVGVDKRTCRVEYMHSLSRKEVRDMPTSSVEPAILPSQTRVYVANRGRWHIGRVVHAQRADGGVTYQIRFPNGQGAPLHENRIEVRCLAPVADPIDAVMAMGFETQWIHDRRTRILEHSVAGRAKAKSLAGLLSASVELYPHQLAVVRRVTEDPLQRYVLADEVGLGKTIEAGAIIRQNLLDDHSSSVLVLAPEHLVEQWRAELAVRFHIDDFGMRVQFKRHDALDDRTDTPDLLVVDEVHLLVERTAGPEYEQLRRLSHAAARVLLLSATPVLNDPNATLRLFHLVDPSAYRLEDADAFAERVDRRLEIGRVMLVLASESSAYVATRVIRMARQVLDDDPEAMRLSDAMEAAVAAESDAAIAECRAEMREYLSDTYRLSKRLLRSRRRDLASQGLFCRDGEVTVESLDDSLGDVVEALNDWRSACASHLYLVSEDVVPSDSDVAPFLTRYRDLLDAASVGPAVLADVAARQLATPRDEPTFADEEALLQRLEKLGRVAVREVEPECEMVRYALRGIKEWRGHQPKLVVFTTSTTLATEITDHLPAYLGYGSTYLITRDTSPEQVHSRILEFEHLSRPAVLILDRAGEDGLNLQFADAVLHLDLPTSLMRIEQRMGRLDRIGRGNRPIRQRVVVPAEDDDSPWMAWFGALSNAFDVFQESASDLQLVAPQLEKLLLTRLLLSGAITAEDVARAREEVATERRRLDEQYALDAVELSDDFASADIDGATSVDRADASLAMAVSGWWEETIGLIRDLPDEAGFRLSWDKAATLPEAPWRLRIQPCLDRRLTYERGVALADLGVRLVRTGSPLVDVMQPLLRYDDRGTAFATWRRVPSLAASVTEWLIFKLVYVVEADIAGEEAKRADRVDVQLQRRVDHLVPPWVETLYFDTNLRPVKRPDLLAALLKPYDQANDRNLGSRLAVLWERIPEDRFAQLFRDAVESASSQLVQDETYKGHLQAVLVQAEQRVRLARAKVDRRRAGLTRLGQSEAALDDEASHLEQELELARSIRPRLDSLGLIILSGQGIP
jgi:ATP-dependent helicase HepA